MCRTCNWSRRPHPDVKRFYREPLPTEKGMKELPWWVQRDIDKLCVWCLMSNDEPSKYTPRFLKQKKKFESKLRELYKILSESEIKELKKTVDFHEELIYASDAKTPMG